MDLEFKVDQVMYGCDVPDVTVLTRAQPHFTDSKLIFQQDSAPTNRAKKINGWYKVHLALLVEYKSNLLKSVLDFGEQGLR